MLDHISCRSFRNLEIDHWEPGAGQHLVLGPNGAGKTSLLEAVYLLATTRSFRASQLNVCARHGASQFHLEGGVGGERRSQLVFGWGTEGRYRSVNGRTTSLVEHLQVLPITAWTLEDREILSGPPSRRRRFVDQGIVGSRPLALETLARFRRTLYQKRQLLLREAKGLEDWNRLLADVVSDLMRLRRSYLERLSAALDTVLRSTDLDLPEVALEYRPSIEVERDEPELVFRELARSSQEERRERRALLGPQRDEVLIRWGTHGVRAVGSAGERKVLGLLLTAARARVLSESGREPVILLDDADSELDRGRLESVWRAFESASQVIVSSSRPEIWSIASDAISWRLEAGRIGRASG